MLRPQIYLTSGMGQEQHKYNLNHERAHIRWGDHIIKSLIFLAFCVHWFNPRLWVVFQWFVQDMKNGLR